MTTRIVPGLLLAFLAPYAIAQATSEASLAAPEEFGSGLTIHNVAPNAFVPRVGLWDNCALNFTNYWAAAGGDCTLGGNFELPAGALLVSAIIFYQDDGVGDPTLRFTAVSGFGTTTVISTVTTFPTGEPGDVALFHSFPPMTVINNLQNVYGIEVNLPVNTRLYRIRLRYQRQVSPAPGVATFPNDVPTTHPFFQFIEALAASGITAGCDTNSFCPDQAVTRGQMAVFLSAALGLHFPN